MTFVDIRVGRFVKVANWFYVLNIVAENSILNVCASSGKKILFDRK